MKCWHCGHKTRNYSDAYIKFAISPSPRGFSDWQEKRVWLCRYCYDNLRRGFQRSKKRIIKPLLTEKEVEA
jgi:hypothetical protein